MFETLSQDANQWRNTEVANFAEEDDDNEVSEFLQEQIEFAHMGVEEPDAKRPKREGANVAVEEAEQQALAAAWKEQLASLREKP